MPIHYDIHPGLDLLAYAFNGVCSADEYFKLYYSIHQNDQRRHPGMRVLVDLFNGVLDYDFSSIQKARSIVTENKERGLPRDRVACLTRNTVLKVTRDAFVVLMGDLPMELEVFHTFHDAAQWLGIHAQEQEAFTFWKRLAEAEA